MSPLKRDEKNHLQLLASPLPQPTMIKELITSLLVVVTALLGEVITFPTECTTHQTLYYNEKRSTSYMTTVDDTSFCDTGHDTDWYVGDRAVLDGMGLGWGWDGVMIGMEKKMGFAVWDRRGWNGVRMG